jgi:putative intracellular protease/amidase
MTNWAIPVKKPDSGWKSLRPHITSSRMPGAQITVASPKGGQPPIGPKSDEPENQTPAMTRFKSDKAAQTVLANTVRLATVKAADYDTVFYSGGHGPMWDLAEDKQSISLIEDFYNSGKPVAAVCHAPGSCAMCNIRASLLLRISASPGLQTARRRPSI